MVGSVHIIWTNWFYFFLLYIAINSILNIQAQVQKAVHQNNKSIILLSNDGILYAFYDIHKFHKVFVLLNYSFYIHKLLIYI